MTAAVVIGASGGIGGSIAKALSDAGAKVALSGTRVDALEKAAADIGGSPVILPCNLADPVATAALVGKAEEALGGLDVIVSNAGLTKDGLLMRMKDEDWETVLNVNLPNGTGPGGPGGQGGPGTRLPPAVATTLAEAGTVQGRVCDPGGGSVSVVFDDADGPAEPGTDVAALADGYVSVTAIRSVVEDGRFDLAGVLA